LNSDLSVAISVSEITPPLCGEAPGPREAVLGPREAVLGPREAVPGPAAGVADEHDASIKPAAPVAVTTANRRLMRVRQATRIPIRFLSLPQA
jgi:hypothetical protein